MSFKVKREEAGKVAGGQSGSGQTAKASASNAPIPAFSVSMSDAETVELLRQLDELTRKLSLFPTERMMYEYRCLVGELMRRSMSAYRLRKDLRWRRNDKGLFVTVEKIESDLELLEEVFQREGLRSKGLQLMEEIKGCLISLLI